MTDKTEEKLVTQKRALVIRRERTVEEIIPSQFSPPMKTRAEQLQEEQQEWAIEAWCSLSGEKTLVSLPKITDRDVERIYDSPTGSYARQQYSAAYYSTIEHLRTMDGQLGVINAIMTMDMAVEDTETKPSQKRRSWSKNIDKV